MFFYFMGIEGINWGDPEAIEKAIGIPDLDKIEFGCTNFDLDVACTGNCIECMQAEIDAIGTKLSAILCCKSHPETGETDEYTGVCPNYEMMTGECRIYNSEEYPLACKNYHCKSHNR